MNEHEEFLCGQIDQASNSLWRWAIAFRDYGGRLPQAQKNKLELVRAFLEHHASNLGQLALEGSRQKDFWLIDLGLVSIGTVEQSLEAGLTSAWQAFEAANILDVCVDSAKVMHFDDARELGDLGPYVKLCGNDWTAEARAFENTMFGINDGLPAA